MSPAASSISRSEHSYGIHDAPSSWRAELLPRCHERCSVSAEKFKQQETEHWECSELNCMLDFTRDFPADGTRAEFNGGMHEDVSRLRCEVLWRRVEHIRE